MRIATFNLEDLGGEKHSMEHIEAHIKALRPQFLRLNADILCLQEVNSKRHNPKAKRGLYAFDRLIKDTPYAGYSWSATTFGERRQFADKHNLVILSRWRISDIQQIHHDLLPAPHYRQVTAEPAADKAAPVHWDRPLLHATIELEDGRPLHVINLHLRAPLAAAIPGQKSGPFSWASSSGWAEGFYLAAMKRAGQALEVRLLVDRIFDADENALILVTGDFNAGLQDTSTRILAADIEDSGNGALSNRMLIPLENRLPEDRRYTIIHNGRKQMLDHMLASRSLLAEFSELEIHNEALGDELVAYAGIDASPQSYHAPVVAEFNLK